MQIRALAPIAAAAMLIGAPAFAQDNATTASTTSTTSKMKAKPMKHMKHTKTMKKTTTKTDK